MEAIEIGLLIVAYTVIILTLFIEVICYTKNLESKETLFLTASMLLMIIAFSSSVFSEDSSAMTESTIFSIVSFILVGLATSLNVLDERKHNFKPILKKGLIAFAAILLVLAVLCNQLGIKPQIEMVATIYLCLSVVLSMILLRRTKPKIRIQHREKIDRIFAVAFIVVVPLSIFASYLLESNNIPLRLGFTIPTIFILLAGSKLWDDINRLSLVSAENTIQDQNIQNFGLTKRETEVADLLIKGQTYRQISEQLFVSIPTVKSHVSNIYKKCGINNKIELIHLLTR